MTIAVDFDGTIVEHKYPKIGKEKPFAIETLLSLADEGHKIILWTSREGELLKDAVDYCSMRGLDFYAVNSIYPESYMFKKDQGRKIITDLYIDDRNLGGLPDWGTIYEMVTGMPGRKHRKRPWWKRIFHRGHHK